MLLLARTSAWRSKIEETLGCGIRVDNQTAAMQLLHGFCGETKHPPKDRQSDEELWWSLSLSGFFKCYSVELEEVTPMQDMGYEQVKTKEKEGKEKS